MGMKLQRKKSRGGRNKQVEGGKRRVRGCMGRGMGIDESKI